jgi:hypothetical protein
MLGNRTFKGFPSLGDYNLFQFPVIMMCHGSFSHVTTPFQQYKSAYIAWNIWIIVNNEAGFLCKEANKGKFAPVL